MVIEQRMTVELLCWGGGVVSHPLQLTTRLVVNSFIITNPTLAGKHMLLNPKLSNLLEQKSISSAISCQRIHLFLSFFFVGFMLVFFLFFQIWVFPNIFSPIWVFMIFSRSELSQNPFFTKDQGKYSMHC